MSQDGVEPLYGFPPYDTWKKKQQSGTLFTQHYWPLFTLDIHNNCYGLPVRLPYIVITCAPIDSIKRVCSEPPCCLGEFSDLSSVHDNNTDTNSNLYFIFIEKKNIIIIIINGTLRPKLMFYDYRLKSRWDFIQSQKGLSWVEYLEQY